MSLVPRSVRVYFATQPVNLRRSFEGLSNEVREVLRHDPLADHVFVFLNRRKTQVKLPRSRSSCRYQRAGRRDPAAAPPPQGARWICTFRPPRKHPTRWPVSDVPPRPARRCCATTRSTCCARRARLRSVARRAVQPVAPVRDPKEAVGRERSEARVKDEGSDAVGVFRRATRRRVRYIASLALHPPGYHTEITNLI
jgi:hypothetical protein